MKTHVLSITKKIIAKNNRILKLSDPIYNLKAIKSIKRNKKY